jgi:hypothetical protein
MKKILFAGPALLLSLAAFLASEQGLIKIEASVNPLRVGRGEEGKVVLKINVKEGITINSQPSFIIEFGPSEDLIFPKNFFTATDLNIEVLEENGKERLNLIKPVEIRFTVNPRAKRGVHVLEGRIKYFACSLKAGWCLKSSVKFSARTLVVWKGS